MMTLALIVLLFATFTILSTLIAIKLKKEISILNIVCLVVTVPFVLIESVTIGVIFGMTDVIYNIVK